MKQGLRAVCGVVMLLMGGLALADDAAPAAVDPAQVDAARYLLRSSGLGELMGHAAQGNFTKAGGLMASASMRLCVQKGIDQNAMEGILAPILPAYMSVDDMNELNTYFATPSGQKVSAFFASGMQADTRGDADKAIQAAMRKSPELKKAFSDFGDAMKQLPQDQDYKKAMVGRVVHVMLYDCRDVMAQSLADMMLGAGPKPAATTGAQ